MRRRIVTKKTFVVLVMLNGAAAMVSHGATMTWDGTGSGNNWTTPGNWLSDTAPANDGSADIRLPFNLADSSKYTINVDSARLINSLLFQNTGSATNTYSLSGSSITIDNEASSVALNAQRPGVTVSIANDLVFSMATVQHIGGSLNTVLQLGGSVSAPTSQSLIFQANQPSTLEVLTSGALNMNQLEIKSIATSATSPLVLKLNDGTSLSDSMVLTLTDGILNKARVNLNFLGTEVVSGLIIDGVSKPAGTYGATGSGAQNIDDVHFMGVGMISIPEPASLAGVAALGAGCLLSTRRRRMA